MVMVCLALAAAGVASRPAEAQEDLLGEPRTIADVRFEGRQRVGAGELRSVMKTRGPSFWPWSGRPALRLDFLRVDTLAIRDRYLHHGYIDARVGVRLTSMTDSTQVTVTFVIREGHRSQVGALEFAGVQSYPEHDLRRRLLLQPGQTFDPYALQLDTLKISELYQEHGFRPHVAASALRGDGLDSLRWRVRYEVEEGPLFLIGDVFYHPAAAPRVSERLVRRELLLKRDDVFRRSRMLRSGERLYDTGLFSQVQISPIVDSTNSRMDFELRLSERKSRWVDAGVGSGTAERFHATGEWGHRNLFGRGFQGALATRIAFNGAGRFLLGRTELSLLEPWLLRTRTRAVLTPFYERTDDRANPEWLVRQRSRGFRAELGRELSRFSRVTVSQNNLWASQDLTLFSDTIPAARKDSLERTVVSRFNTHSIALGALRDYRDNPLSATKGSMQAVNVELAGGPLKGTSSFRKVDVVSAFYTPFWNGWVLALRARGGVIKPTGDGPSFSLENEVDEEVTRVPPNDRFKTGGVNSIRGFGESKIAPDGGLALIQANAELRIPLVGPFGLEVFVDAGNVWARPSYIKRRDFSPRWNGNPLSPNDVRYVFGIGPRINLPIGPLRLDVAWKLRPPPGEGQHVTKYQFAIGPSF
jgi:outer membrane protein insertion porin family